MPSRDAKQPKRDFVRKAECNFLCKDTWNFNSILLILKYQSGTWGWLLNTQMRGLTNVNIIACYSMPTLEWVFLPLLQLKFFACIVYRVSKVVEITCGLEEMRTQLNVAEGWKLPKVESRVVRFCFCFCFS